MDCREFAFVNSRNDETIPVIASAAKQSILY